MQSDRNSSKTGTFYEPTTYKPQIITFARHVYGRVGFFLLELKWDY